MHSGTRIRRARKDDLVEVRRVCALSIGGAAPDRQQADAAGLAADIYAAPYLMFDGCICIVAEAGEGLAGYAVGAIDTRIFESRLETGWWPGLRTRHALPRGDRSRWSSYEFRAWTVHHPAPSPDAVVERFPAHIHMHLLPAFRGRGLGTRLLETWIDAAQREKIAAVHATVGAGNSAGLRFWTSRGFAPVLQDALQGSAGRIWCGRTLGTDPSETRSAI